MPGPARASVTPSFPAPIRMQSPKRDLSSSALPPALIYATAMTCGVLAALALQIYLRGAGFDFASLWGEGAFGVSARELRTTGPWWAIAGIAFVTSGITAAALSRFPPPWRRLRLLRWLAGAALVLLLAQLGHPSGAPEGVGPGIHLAASLAALVVAAVIGLLGAYVAVRR
jgi:hypothetical protein